MKRLIKKYKLLSFEKKTVTFTLFSIIFNAILAIGKIILSIFQGVFFLVAGILNIFILLSKLECFLGIKYPKRRTFEYRNNMIGIYLILAGIQYGIYMSRLVFTDVKTMEYSMFLGINIALISFIELGIAIKGLFNAYGKGHYYRNIKLINLCSAFTAMVLTEVAITSFASEVDTRIMDGIFGMSVGGVIILISGFILIAPKISIVDKEHNVYKLKENSKSLITLDENNKVKILLTNSKVCGNYTYVGEYKEGIIDGHIIKGKSPIFSWNIYIKILIIVLSEILIFVYAIWSLIFYFKSYKIIQELDKYMENNNYLKIENEEF